MQPRVGQELVDARRVALAAEEGRQVRALAAVGVAPQVGLVERRVAVVEAEPARSVEPLVGRTREASRGAQPLGVLLNDVLHVILHRHECRLVQEVARDHEAVAQRCHRCLRRPSPGGGRGDGGGGGIVSLSACARWAGAARAAAVVAIESMPAAARLRSLSSSAATSPI
eukprot:6590607-Prymnesium_polylepis.1